MPLTAGTRLGPYEVISAIGAGGMGEVYRATDTRLNRQVALKILPAHLATDPDLAQRFEREARAIAGLSHPHICTLFDVGHDNGTEYLVMELLDGETLAAALEKGPLPFDRAMTIAMQIADALDCAHRAGIVHRDLKPGNVMLTAAGAKVLDFGLARVGVPHAIAMSGPSVAATMQSPPITARGMILGTLQYMAPEQLEGGEADTRTDVFAFGTVLYEMLTGRRAFAGTSQASLIGAILKDEPPPVSAVQAIAPPALDRLVSRCLAKRPDDRWQTIRDVRLELEWLKSGATTSAPATPPARASSSRRWRELVAWGAAVLAIAAAAILATRRQAPAIAGPVVRFDLPIPPEIESAMVNQNLTNTFAAPSPDGRWIARTGPPRADAPIVLIRLDSGATSVLKGTEGGVAPFWSPDGQQLGFVQNQRLVATVVPDGTPRTLGPCDGCAATWLNADTVLFATAPTAGGGGISRLRLSTGATDRVTEVDAGRGEVGHRAPRALPDGEHFLFVAGAKDNRATTFVGSVASPGRTALAIESNVAYVDPGYLLFAKSGALVAQAFDPARLVLRGEPVLLVPSLVRVGSAAAAPYRFDASRNGVLTFWSVGDSSLQTSQLTWVNRQGKVVQTLGSPEDYSSPSLSPDRTRIATGIRAGAEGKRDIWILDAASGRRIVRLTSDPEDDLNPSWADDRTIYFSSDRSGQRRVYRTLVSEPGQEQLVTDDAATGLMINIESVRGDTLVLNAGRGGAPHLRTLATAGGRSEVLIELPQISIKEGVLSPDGRWLAYNSDESGQSQITVTTFPVSTRRWSVSTNGGSQPQWSRNGSELFYIEGAGRFMAVSVTTTGGEFKSGTPQFLFEQPLPTAINFRNKYVADDGRRFLVTVTPDATPRRRPNFVVISDWRSLITETGK